MKYAFPGGYQVSIIHDCSVYCSSECFERDREFYELNPDEASEFIHWEGAPIECDRPDCTNQIESEYGETES